MSQRQTDMLLQRGLLLLQQDQAQAAAQAWRDVLQAEPEHAQALQSLAQLALSQGQANEAELLLARSLRAHPELPASWALLGELHEGQARSLDAQACYRKAAQLAPDQSAHAYNLARSLRSTGHLEDAWDCLGRAMRQASPPSSTLWAQMLQLRALLQEDAGDLAAALATLDLALQQAPERAALHHNRGVLLQRLARPAQALQAHDQALSLGLQVADAHYNRGNSLQSLGRHAQALAAYRAALQLEPLHELALFDTARLRWRQGDDDFSAELDAAAGAAPHAALPWGIKGRLLLRAERYAVAEHAFDQATRLAPETAAFHDGRAQALARLGRFDEALAAHARAVQLQPAQAAVYITQAATLLQAGDVARAGEVAQAAVRLDPLDQQAWAFLGVAWRAAGDPRETWLNDYLRQVRVIDIPAPAGWSDVLSFNQALARELERLHTDSHAPIDQTLRQGSQTLGDIFEQAHALVDQLKAAITTAIDQHLVYLASLPADTDHPLLGRLNTSWKFSDSWSSRLRSQGFHTHHVHPHGWISSCYYVDLPPTVQRVRDGPGCGPGWLVFGQPDRPVGSIELPPVRSVQPRVGTLVLFPSFMWHGTVPFADEAARLTIAFDVLPAD